jgi:hypothetical protein
MVRAPSLLEKRSDHEERPHQAEVRQLLADDVMMRRVPIIKRQHYCTARLALFPRPPRKIACAQGKVAFVSNDPQELVQLPGLKRKRIIDGPTHSMKCDDSKTASVSQQPAQ